MNQENPYEPPKSEVADIAADDSALASRGARLGAALIDGLLAACIMFPMMFATGYWQEAMSGRQPSFSSQLNLMLVGLVIYLVMHGYLLHKSGQTIGKRLVGTRIVSVDDNRILPFWKVVTVRTLPIMVVGQIPFVGGLLTLVDCLFVFRSDRRCAHDLIAGTKVVNASSAWKTADA